MNTREIAEEYRLTYWSEIMRERQESGLSVRAYSAKAGFHENRYYYWQRKLREAAVGELRKIERVETGLTPVGFTEIKLEEEPREKAEVEARAEKSEITIEATGLKITTDSEYPIEKLAALVEAVSGR